MTVGEKIKYLREQNKMGQRELAERCELTQSTISTYENDKVSEISPEYLEKIGDALGVSGYFLSSYSGDVTSTERLRTECTRIGLRIKIWRKANHLTQANLAEQLGIDNKLMSKFETGTFDIRNTAYENILDKLKILFEDLDNIIKSVSHEDSLTIEEVAIDMDKKEVISSEINSVETPYYKTKDINESSEEIAFTERYMCDCGKLKGKIHDGGTCPYCNTIVKYRDVLTSSDDTIFRSYINIFNGYEDVEPYMSLLIFEDIFNRISLTSDKKALEKQIEWYGKFIGDNKILKAKLQLLRNGKDLY